MLMDSLGNVFNPDAVHFTGVYKYSFLYSSGSDRVYHVFSASGEVIGEITVRDGVEVDFNSDVG